MDFNGRTEIFSTNFVQVIKADSTSDGTIVVDKYCALTHNYITLVDLVNSLIALE